MQTQGAIDIVFLCFTEKWWDWEKTAFAGRTATFARGLARDGRVGKVLVVDTPTSLLGTLRRGQRAGEPIWPGAECRQVLENVFVLDQTRLLPRERHHSLAAHVNGMVHDSSLSSEIARATKHLGMARPVYWLSGPTVAKYAGESPLMVYDAVDEWLAHPSYAAIRSEVSKGYERVRRHASVVFAVTPTLAAQFEGSRPRVVVLPNGVHPEAYQLPAHVPERLNDIPRPRAGYIGALQQRLDVELLVKLAGRMQDLQFVLVGPIVERGLEQRLSGLQNVHLLGPCPATDVPGYLEGFDVCLLPHVDCPLTQNMDPVKLYEYIAARKPVVASDLPGLTQPLELVSRASSADEWERAVRDGLSRDMRSRSGLIDRFVEENSWDSRVTTAVDELVALSSSAQGSDCERMRRAM